VCLHLAEQVALAEDTAAAGAKVLAAAAEARREIGGKATLVAEANHVHCCLHLVLLFGLWRGRNPMQKTTRENKKKKRRMKKRRKKRKKRKEGKREGK
jgi:hypothetical protein